MAMNRPDENTFFSGFLVSCNDRRERDAVKEFYRLMDRKIESVYGEMNPENETLLDDMVKAKLEKRDHVKEEIKEKIDLKKVKIDEQDNKVEIVKTEKEDMGAKDVNIKKEKKNEEEEDNEGNKNDDQKDNNGKLEETLVEDKKIDTTEGQKTEKDKEEEKPKVPPKPEVYMTKFKQMRINKKGVLFFKLNEIYENKINLLKISDSIVQDFRDGLTSKYTKIFKITPIEVCCFASFENFEHYTKLLFNNYLKPIKENHTLSGFIKIRNNSKFTKTEISEFLQENKPENFKLIDYKGDYVVFVDIVQVIFCIL